jgi:aspartate/methionine/tyrosine aminotransferase
MFSGEPPAGAFYAFLKINRDWTDDLPAASDRPEAPGSPDLSVSSSLSWRMAAYLIRNGRIGCVPGVDFGRQGEGYLRFCFARDRAELTGALESMKTLALSLHRSGA